LEYLGRFHEVGDSCQLVYLGMVVYALTGSDVLRQQAFQPARHWFHEWLQIALQAHDRRRKLWHCRRFFALKNTRYAYHRWAQRVINRQMTRAQLEERRQRTLALHGGKQAFARWWHHRCESMLKRVGHELTGLLADCLWFNQRVHLGDEWEFDTGSMDGATETLLGSFVLSSLPASEFLPTSSGMSHNSTVLRDVRGGSGESPPSARHRPHPQCRWHGYLTG
jgi:hypothetical protein